MATVYRGFDVNLHRPVAIKVLSAALAADPDYVNRFRQEARLIANLRHPHIAQVFAFGEHAGAPYMIQELLPGPTLEQRLKDLAARHEPMPRQDVIATITQLADALDAAHAVGVIHRDVKPSNALYNAEGQIVLADFGIARSAADASRTATAAGVVMGTPGYIAPEQAISSAALTPACDIYALGVVLFELLCGRLPFEADTAMGVVLKHLYDPPPPPTSVRPELPPAIDTVVLRALEKEPTARFSSASALAQALAAAWPVSAVPAPVPAAPDIHSQATSIWSGAPRPAMAQPSPAPTPPAQSGSIAPRSTAGSAARDASSAAMPARGRPRLLMPLLGLLLVGLLILGAALAARGVGIAPGAPSAAPARSTAPAVSAATSGAVTAEPSAAPTSPSPTAPIAPTVQANTTGPTPASSAGTAEPPPPDCGTTITASANADAWIEQNSASNNKGTDSILKVKSQGPSDNFRALVRFALPASVPQGCVVQSATLRLFAASSAIGSHPPGPAARRRLDGERRHLEQPARDDRRRRHDQRRAAATASGTSPPRCRPCTTPAPTTAS